MQMTHKPTQDPPGVSGAAVGAGSQEPANSEGDGGTQVLTAHTADGSSPASGVQVQEGAGQGFLSISPGPATA